MSPEEPYFSNSLPSMRTSLSMPWKSVNLTIAYIEAMSFPFRPLKKVLSRMLSSRDRFAP